MTAPAIYVRGATMAATRRTNMRKAFLAPWHPEVQSCWHYALASAQQETGVAIHHGVQVVNHQHLNVTPRDHRLPEFLRRVNRETSCAIQTLLARERYDTPGQLWDGRSTHIMRLLDPATQAGHLVYEALNTVAAGLVERPEHMPGLVLDFRHWKTGGVWVERPSVYMGAHRPERLWLELTPPPLLYEAFDGDLDALVHHMTRLRDDGLRALRDARKRPALGAQALRRLHPWSEPKTLAASRGRPVPTFKVAQPGWDGAELRCLAAQDTTRFRNDHRSARAQWVSGDRDVEFPYGTYGARVFHGARVCEVPPTDGIVCLPGPQLDEVKAKLAERRCATKRDADRLADRVAVTEGVRSTWRDAAAHVAAAEDLELVPAERRAPKEARGTHADAPPGAGADAAGCTDGRPEGTPTEESDPAARPEPVERHRFAKVDDDGGAHPRRLVIRRDRRRGRPPGRRSGDPPR